MKIIYANIVFYIFVLYGLLGSTVTRLLSTDWQNMGTVKAEYDFIWLAFSIWIIVIIYGLLKNKKWSYDHALSINAVLAFTPIILISVAIFMLWQDLIILDLLQGTVFEITISILGFVFWLAMLKSDNVKKLITNRLSTPAKGTGGTREKASRAP